ncbi:DNA-directed RNA polymerase sigma-70 factor [Phytohabitans suffuscus]|uniref:DNA-directed RNA polymerase sigma-70 factor n=1 Tax=Phytohabitans suffuscus TaxID=624315 RepID=A0A6F8YUW3_9ACTN|nr:DNA-directed RNA polymerase sigma-70 factor [Phytohabitans suffuscus]
MADSGGRLIRVAMALTGDRHAAEDLLQSALTSTAARWRHLDGDPEAYVRRAMYHAQVTIWRRRQRLRETPTAHMPERADHRDEIGATDRRLALRQALMRLAPRQRAVLVARFYEDLSEEDTAALLGCSPGTVRSQLHRALARLRQIAPELHDDHLTEEKIR